MERREGRFQYGREPQLSFISRRRRRKKAREGSPRKRHWMKDNHEGESSMVSLSFFGRSVSMKSRARYIGRGKEGWGRWKEAKDLRHFECLKAVDQEVKKKRSLVSMDGYLLGKSRRYSRVERVGKRREGRWWVKGRESERSNLPHFSRGAVTRTQSFFDLLLPSISHPLKQSCSADSSLEDIFDIREEENRNWEKESEQTVEGARIATTSTCVSSSRLVLLLRAPSVPILRPKNPSLQVLRIFTPNNQPQD